MSMKVYTVSGAPRPWRVLLGLAFKGIAFERVILEATRGDLKAEEFLAINKRGKVPVVIDGEIVLRDSIASLAWLDRAYPDRPLFGETLAEAATIWQMVEEMAEYLRPAQNAVLSPIFFDGATEATPALGEAAQTLLAELQPVEDALSQSEFLAGATPSAADAVVFPEVRILQRANETFGDVMTGLGLGELYSRFPATRAWVGRIEALPGCPATFPPHWTARAA